MPQSAGQSWRIASAAKAALEVLRVCAQLRCRGEWEQGRRGGLAGGAATAQQAQRLQRYFYRYMTRWTTTRLPLSAVLMNDASQPHSRIRHLPACWLTTGCQTNMYRVGIPGQFPLFLNQLDLPAALQSFLTNL